VPKGQEQMVNAFMIAQYLPSWVSILFVFVVFAGLISVLDIQFSSVASMAGHDIYKKFKNDDADESSISYARWGMFIAAVLGIGIAFIPGITLLHIFLFFATLRASVWLPSMVAVLRPDWFTEKGLFNGMLMALVIGIPTFVYGSLIKDTDISLAGTLIAILGSFVFSWMFSKKRETINIPC
jgi:Na+/proline symporter